MNPICMSPIAAPRRAAALLLASCLGASGAQAQLAGPGFGEEAVAGPAGSAPPQAWRLDGRRPTAATGPAGDVQVWRQALLVQQLDRTQVGLGVAVRTPVVPGGPLASQRGADTTGLRGAGSTPSLAGPVMALVSVGQPLADGVSVGMGVRVPVGATPAARLRGAAGDAALRDGRGEVQMALSFSTRSAASDLRPGLALRMDLGGATALSLRPRGGGRVLVQLTSQW